jgi:hypothetical protein
MVHIDKSGGRVCVYSTERVKPRNDMPAGQVISSPPSLFQTAKCVCVCVFCACVCMCVCMCVCVLCVYTAENQCGLQENKEIRQGAKTSGPCVCVRVCMCVCVMCVCVCVFVYVFRCAQIKIYVCVPAFYVSYILYACLHVCVMCGPW